MPKRNNPHRITLPKRNISTGADGVLAGGMGMNPPSIGNTPGILPGLAALAKTLFPQRLGLMNAPSIQQAFPQPTVNAGRGNVPTNPALLPANLRYTPPTPTSVLLSEATPETRAAALGQVYRDYSLDINARLRQAKIEGSRPPVLTMADAIRLNPGLGVDDVKSLFADMGYEYVSTSQGGILRNIREGGSSTDGSKPIGNSPGEGYTWSNGAWHAPRGQDPNSNIKSVYYSRSRGYVTPEVARLLNKRKRMRSYDNQKQRQQQAANATPAEGYNTTAEGLVTLRASFG